METYTEHDVRQVKEVFESFCTSTGRKTFPHTCEKILDFMISKTHMFNYHIGRIEEAKASLNRARAELAEYKDSL